MNDIINGVLGGLLGTAVMTGMMLFGRRLHLPAVDAHGILGYVMDAKRANGLGYLMHFVMGAIFAIGYVLVFQNLEGDVLILGAILGIIHWLLVGWMFAFAPLIHAGMKAGTVEPTGAYMLKSLGIIGFIAGGIGHVIFGLVVAGTYLALGGS